MSTSTFAPKLWTTPDGLRYADLATEAPMLLRCVPDLICSDCKRSPEGQQRPASHGVLAWDDVHGTVLVCLCSSHVFALRQHQEAQRG